MTIQPVIKTRIISVALLVIMSLGYVLLRPSTTQAIVPPTFAAAILQALPGVETLVGKLFPTADKKAKKTEDQKATIAKMTTDSEDAKKQLATYAQREQVIWRLVASSGQVSRGVSALVSATTDKTTLTEAEATQLDSISDLVTAGIQTIVKSDPHSKLFEPDALQVSAIDDLLEKAPTLAASVSKDLKYSAKPAVEAVLVKDLHTQLTRLDNIFAALDRATAAEIQMIADGLSAVSAPAPPKSDDKKGIKAASDAASSGAFTNVLVLDNKLSNRDLDEALEKMQKNEDKI